MSETIGALLPIFLVILLGFALNRFAVMGETMWSAFEHLAFYVLFPALIVKTLAGSDFSGLSLGPFVLALAIASLVQALLLILAKPLLARVFGLNDAGFTSVFQGATRWHGFIALAIVTALYGAEGIALVAVAIVVLLPLLNIQAIAVLSKWGERPPDVRPRIMRQILLNPLILATIVGGALNVSGLGLPWPFATGVGFLAGGALGISLLTVGAGLRPIRGGTAAGVVAFGVVFRLVVNPAIMFAVCTAFGVSGIERTIAVFCAAVPTAVNSYVFARKMGGDAELMAGIITAQILAAALTVPLAITLLEAL